MIQCSEQLELHKNMSPKDFAKIVSDTRGFFKNHANGFEMLKNKTKRDVQEFEEGNALFVEYNVNVPEEMAEKIESLRSLLSNLQEMISELDITYDFLNGAFERHETEALFAEANAMLNSSDEEGPYTIKLVSKKIYPTDSEQKWNKRIFIS